MPPAPPRIYVCFEPDQDVCAARLDSWTHTNADHAEYNRRTAVSPDSPEAEPFKKRLMTQIHAADVTVCLITGSAFMDPWIAWELETACAKPNRHGPVGILLREHYRYPPAMQNRGSMFVPFRREAIERAIDWAMESTETREDFTLLDD